MIQPPLDPSITVFDTAEHPEIIDSNVQMAVVYNESGSIEALALIDDDRGDLVEMTPEVAVLLIAKLNELLPLLTGAMH